jgi:hypothetical protein
MVDGLTTTRGALKAYSKIAESGNEVTNYFCGDCGSTLYRTSTGFSGVVIIRAGCIDDLDVEDAQPTYEVFSRSHIEWVPCVKGIEQNVTGIFGGLVQIYSGVEIESKSNGQK